MQNVYYADNIFPIGTFLFGTLSLMLAFPKLRAFQLFAARSFRMTFFASNRAFIETLFLLRERP